MSWLRLRVPRGIRYALAWMGLLLMVVSFALLQWTSKPRAPVSRQAPPPREPFAVVVLDPGHGGQDSGAKVGNMLEKDFTLEVARRVDRLLQAQGFATVMTRVGDAYVSLADRAALANRVPNCVFVSIHFNEDNKPVASGVETYYAAHQITRGLSVASWFPFLWPAISESPNLESEGLAGYIQEELAARTQSLNRGTKARQFFVISNVRHPAVLIEGGFLSNKEDMAKLESDDYREQMATAISAGIIRYRDFLKERQAPTAATTPEAAE
jgi:N-acetylmuramoyl-L-alanine amidase